MRFLGFDAAQWQALGTMVLVLVTLGYVIYTSQLAEHARSSADSAAKSATSAERALQLTVMPILHFRRAGRGPTGFIRVHFEALTSAPAFGVQVVVSQGNREWTSGLIPVIRRPQSGELLPFDIAAEPAPDFDQPYNATATYYDALGAPYRARRIGYLNAMEMKLDQLNDSGEWVNLV